MNCSAATSPPIERDPTFDENDELITEDRLEEMLVQHWPTPSDQGNEPTEIKAHAEYPSW